MNIKNNLFLLLCFLVKFNYGSYGDNGRRTSEIEGILQKHDNCENKWLKDIQQYEQKKAAKHIENLWGKKNNSYFCGKIIIGKNFKGKR